MIDLHSHLLPGIDDGAPDTETALRMANMFVADGVEIVACTPHILPGLYHNSGMQIRDAVTQLQAVLDTHEIPLRLIAGADNHVVPDFAAQLRSGHLLSLNASRYVLVEPPHHVAPARMEDMFFNILLAGYVPILTHPERLTWMPSQYEMMKRLVRGGVWMQITSGSLAGAFGKDPRYWGERMLDDGLVHILATDAHDVRRRPPDLKRGRELAARRVGEAEATHLVVTRPMGIVSNLKPSEIPSPLRGSRSDQLNDQKTALHNRAESAGVGRSGDNITDRLRRFFR